MIHLEMGELKDKPFLGLRSLNSLCESDIKWTPDLNVMREQEHCPVLSEMPDWPSDIINSSSLWQAAGMWGVEV